jgi:hypothetical protein
MAGIERQRERKAMMNKPYRLRRRAWLAAVLLPLLLWAAPSAAQSRIDKGGVTLYWGLVPAAVVAQKHSLEELHGGPSKAGGQVHHLVIALFDSGSGRRIDDAVVRAQLSEIGIADGAPKYLTPMKVNDQASYGQVFGVAKEGPYRFKVWVRLPSRQDDIEFAFSAGSPHRPER